ncbi:unnamed protein product, partial [Staurois parvus]
MTAGTGLDIGSSDWTAGIGSPGIKSFGSTASTASSGKGSGLRVNWHDRGHRGQTLNRLAGQRASGHQASVIWLDSGHRVIWQGSGLRVNRHDSGHRVIRYRIVWLDSGHRVIRHQVIWLASGHRVIWQGSGHRVTRYDSGSESIGTTAGTGSGTGSSGSTAGIESTG